MFLIYSVLFTLGVIFTAPYYLWKLRGRVTSGVDWRERFGALPQKFAQNGATRGGGAVWAHAVSLGETLAITGLIDGIRKRYPQRRIFLSHVTPAGREAGGGRMEGVAGRFYAPLDWRWCVRRALTQLRPELLLVVETELWPNLLFEAHRNGTRIALVNARISDRSFKRYLLLRPFLKQVIGCVDWVGAQTTQDAERFLRLGANPANVTVVGNLKFDGRPPQLGDWGKRLERTLKTLGRRPVVVAASTMAGEEALLLQVWAGIRRRHPQAILILAPRHPARFGLIAKLLAETGRNFERRTNFETEETDIARQISNSEILLLDTIGELAGILELADIVFVGGSLVPTGGHNLIEAAYWGKPILFGPHMENFREIAHRFLEAGAAVQVESVQGLLKEMTELLQNEGRRQELGRRAALVLERESGATDRVLDHLHKWLDVNEDRRAKAARSEAP